MSLYKNLIENISAALSQSLNEMARMTPVRTIDRKLWLTVASACSRNRSTEAENVKPVGNDKDNLVQRYVAALLIMKKPCPQTVEEIAELKTFKLVAKKAFQLGATLEDIQKLYAQNSGTAPAKPKPQQPKPQPKPVEQSKSNSNSLFDDDLFGDDDDYEYDGSGTDLADTIAGFDPNTKLDVVLVNLIGIDKPKGFKKYKAGTLYEYEAAVQDSEVYYRCKYVRDFERLLEEKGWTLYNIPIINCIDGEYDIHTREEFIQAVRNYLKRNNWEPEYIENKIDSYIQQYDEWLTLWNKFYNRLTDKFDKEFFKNKLIKKAYISPDRGMIYYVKRIPHKGSYSYGFGNHVLTFTGEVNYNALMNSTATSIDAVKNAKLEKQCLAKYKEFLKNTVHIRFGWRFIMYNGRPICVASIGQNSINGQSTWFLKHFGSPIDGTSDPQGMTEFKYKNAERDGDYVRVLFRYNKDKKFGDGDVALITYLTEKGIQRFNEYYNKKYESILRLN